MLLKDGIRIGGLSAAIALAIALQYSPQEPENWAEGAGGIKPVKVETAILPHPPGHPV